MRREKGPRPEDELAKRRESVRPDDMDEQLEKKMREDFEVARALREQKGMDVVMKAEAGEVSEGDSEIIEFEPKRERSEKDKARKKGAA